MTPICPAMRLTPQYAALRLAITRKQLMVAASDAASLLDLGERGHAARTAAVLTKRVTRLEGQLGNRKPA